MAQERGYGQFCPVSKAAQVFCVRWTPLIIRDLGAGATRFSDLQRGVPLMSPSLLSSRLKELEREGIVERRKAARGRGSTYHLTAAGEELVPLVKLLGTWGQRWSRRELEEGELDIGLLIFGMEMGVQPAALPPERCVIQLEFGDQPANKRHFWFVNEAGRVAVCLEEPEGEPDLVLVTTLRTMVEIWMGDRSLTGALDSEHLTVHGPTRLKRLLRAWLALSPFAGVKPASGADTEGNRHVA